MLFYKDVSTAIKGSQMGNRNLDQVMIKRVSLATLINKAMNSVYSSRKQITISFLKINLYFLFLSMFIHYFFVIIK